MLRKTWLVLDALRRRDFASMRPQRNAAENSLRLYAGDKEKLRFNEAAA